MLQITKYYPTSEVLRNVTAATVQGYIETTNDSLPLRPVRL